MLSTENFTLTIQMLVPFQNPLQILLLGWMHAYTHTDQKTATTPCKYKNVPPS